LSHCGVYSLSGLGFEDLSVTSGADATDLDSNGVCLGDLDNDGGLVFSDISATSGIRDMTLDGTTDPLCGQRGRGEWCA